MNIYEGRLWEEAELSPLSTTTSLSVWSVTTTVDAVRGEDEDKPEDRRKRMAPKKASSTAMKGKKTVGSE